MANKEKFLHGVTIEIDNPGLPFHRALNSFDTIRKFFQREKEFWESIPVSNRPQFVNSYISHFSSCLQELDLFLEKMNVWNESEYENQWSSRRHIFEKIRLNNSFTIFFSSTPQGDFVCQTLTRNLNSGIQVYQFFNGDRISIDNRDQFIGLLQAYEFQQQGEIPHVRRRDVERKTLGKIRGEWEQKVNDVNKEFVALTDEMSDWQADVVKEQGQWYQEKTKEVETFVEAKNVALEELEKIYREKLRLEAPVELWQRRTRHFKKLGIIWTSLLGVSVVALIVTLICVLYNMPDAFNYNLFKGEPLAVKGVIVFASIISFGAYLAIVFSRLTFSSFHLQRDSEEREQLTYLFLALIKDTTIEEKERELILQAIFSRAETGLLKNDSTPTMPGIGTLLERFVNK